MQTHQECMATLQRVIGKVSVVESEDQLLRLETKLLVEEHSGIVNRHMQCHVFSHACLQENMWRVNSSTTLRLSDWHSKALMKSPAKSGLPRQVKQSSEIYI